MSTKPGEFHYHAGGGSTLAVSAPAFGPGSTAFPGSVFAFHGIGPVGPVSAPDAMFAGPFSAAGTGFGLAFLGSGGSLGLVGIGSPSYTENLPNGRVDLFAGDIGTNPFGGTHAIYIDSRATALQDGFGAMVVGGAYVNGATASIIGDGAPDVVLGGLTESGSATRIYILTGQNATITRHERHRFSS